MRRSKMVKQLVKGNPTKLAKLLEGGESPIGLIGYIPIDGNRDDEGGSVYVKVKVVRLQVGDSCIKVVVTPVSGDGELEISPTSWLDTTGDVKALREREEKLAKAVRDFKEIMVRPNLIQVCRNRAADYLPEEHPFYGAIQEHIKETYGKGIKQLSKSDLASVVKAMVCEVHGVHPEDRDTYNLQCPRY